jgi:hypothetical protein
VAEYHESQVWYNSWYLEGKNERFLSLENSIKNKRYLPEREKDGCW